MSMLKLHTANGSITLVPEDGTSDVSLMLPAQNGILVTTESPEFTGTPTAPTAAVGTNTTQVATTAFVLANAPQTTLSALGITASASELNYVDGVSSSIQGQLNDKAPLASPALTGTPTGPTPATGDNSTRLATTAFVQENSIGVNQTWQDVTSSRTSGTTYTNSTGKPIFVVIQGCTADGNMSKNIFIDGIAMLIFYGHLDGINRQSTCFIVPNGSTYSCTYTASGFNWAELR